MVEYPSPYPSAASVKVPTSNPSNEVVRKCMLCGYGMQFTRPNEYVEFANSTLSGTCESIAKGTSYQCDYYKEYERLENITRICGCTQWKWYNRNTTPADLSMLLFVLIGSLSFLIVCGLCFWRTACLRRRFERGAQTRIVTPQEGTVIRPINVPISREESDHEARVRRSRVLMFLFPTDTKLEQERDEPKSGNALIYNAQLKQYVFCEEKPEDISCSICLELLGSEDDTVSGLCSHVYHRDCIMNWMKGGHDECPNCRRSMWDPATYAMIDECINAEQNGTTPAAIV